MTVRLARRIGMLEASIGPHERRPDFSAVSDEELERAMTIQARYGGYDASGTLWPFHDEQTAEANRLALGAEIAKQCPVVAAAIRKARA